MLGQIENGYLLGFSLGALTVHYLAWDCVTHGIPPWASTAAVLLNGAVVLGFALRLIVPRLARLLGLGR